LVEKCGRKCYVTERNGRSFWTRQGTAHDNEMNESFIKR
jgi:hypothetical protein